MNYRRTFFCVIFFLLSSIGFTSLLFVGCYCCRYYSWCVPMSIVLFIFPDIFTSHLFFPRVYCCWNLKVWHQILGNLVFFLFLFCFQKSIEWIEMIKYFVSFWMSNRDWTSILLSLRCVNQVKIMQRFSPIFDCFVFSFDSWYVFCFLLGDEIRISLVA